MRKILTAVALMAAMLSTAGGDTAGVSLVAPSGKPSTGRVLIVSGESTLEAQVVSRLAALLRAEGCIVRRIPVTQVQKFRPDSFDVTILMSAIDKDHLKKPYLDFVNKYGHKDVLAKVIIAKVGGEQWQEKQLAIDAVTGASSALEPAHIAERLQKNVDLVLSGARNNSGQREP